MNPRREQFAWLMLAVLAAGSCEDPLALSGLRPATAQEREIAASWYGWTAECLRLPDRSHRVTWYVADSITYHGNVIGGVTRGDIIYLSSPDNDAFFPKIARHESMHHILSYSTGDPDNDHRDDRWSACASMYR